MTLVAPGSGDPELSVVMVTHGAWSLTEQALDALRANTARPFELIVVDNCSQDETRERLSALDGALVVLNEENEGFGPACNRGATHARADQLLFLNTDAFVSPGWLEPLRETMRDSCVGAVVPQYLNPDGSLQDAGSLLAQDGTVFAYGVGEDPSHPAYRFPRAIDYGTAACMLVRRDVFETLGGFDDGYAPAYYEDVDLCLRIAAQGMRVMYEPRATVTHVLHGSGELDAAVALSQRNRRRFIARWGEQLIGRPWTLAPDRPAEVVAQSVIAARDAGASPRVLLAAGPGEDGAPDTADALLALWPGSRVTWIVSPPNGDQFDPEPWLELGVEALLSSADGWIDQRLFHYDLVILGSEIEEELLAAIRRTQPQASELSLAATAEPLAGLNARLVTAATGAGIAPP